MQTSTAVVCGLGSCGSWAYLPQGMWDLSGPGIEPVSSALAGRVSSSGPPGKGPPPIRAGFWWKSQQKWKAVLAFPCMATHSQKVPDSPHTFAYLASGWRPSDTALNHSSSFGVSWKKKASLLRSSSWNLLGEATSQGVEKGNVGDGTFSDWLSCVRSTFLAKLQDPQRGRKTNT